MNTYKRGFFIQAGLTLLLIVGLLCISGRCFADYDYINIKDPFIRKIPIAIPNFKAMTKNPSELPIAAKAAGDMDEALGFTGYFKIIDSGAYLENPQEKGVAAGEINFKNWSDIGAELLITGGVTVNGDQLQMELRLFDPFKGSLLLGKRYTGSLSDERKMVLRFCSEMVYQLTGKQGLFNSKIAFISTTPRGKDLFVCDFDGRNPRRITTSGGITLFPAWSSDGKSIAYTSYKDGNPDIFIHTLDTGQETKIAHKGINISPAWVPGQDLLAATLSYQGDEEIYLLTPSGKIVKRLTSTWGVDVSPTFSPNGKQMAFVSNRVGSPQIFIKNLDSGAVHRLTFEGSYNTQPRWCPTGDKIVYSGMNGGVNDIYVIDVKSGAVTRLTRDAGNNESPSWSPDGSMIVFTSTRNGPWKLFVMTASGTDQRVLVNMKGNQTLPAWSPALNQ